jgi:UPF0755 protein
VNRVFVPVSLLSVAVIYVFLQMGVPAATLEKPLEIRIEKGMSFKQAASVLHGHGLIRDTGLFVALGRVTGLHRRLIPGYYLMPGTPSPWEVFKFLGEGRIIRQEITIVEGDTLNEIRDKLLLKDIMSRADFNVLSTDREFLERMRIEAPSLEGYLFPDTYSIPKGMKPEEVLVMMVERLREKYDASMAERARAINLEERDVLALASIIEKEARVDSERAVISAVYHNRLRKGMRLQADPTAIYGIKLQRQGVTRKDIKRRTKYNTYFLRGLPPGPIASPGIKSIEAALYPADVPYLYFVSNNDGTHTFSATAKEHQRAVRRYRASRSRNKGQNKL